MEEATANPKPSLLQSAYTRANAAAEPGLTSGNGFVNEPIGDLTNLDRSLFAENTRVRHLDYGHYSGAYESLATPGNCTSTYTNPWAKAHLENHTFAPFVDSSPSRLTESTFATGAAYNAGIALPTAPNPYIWGPVVSKGPMDEYEYIGAADFQYPDPSLSMMNPFAADPYGNNYQDQFPTNGFDTQLRTAVDEFPRAFHALDSDVTPFDMIQWGPPPRPTCANCNRSFGRQADLDRHAKIHKADSKVFQCAVARCRYGCYRKDKLNEHVKRRHQVLGAAAVRL